LSRERPHLPALLLDMAHPSKDVPMDTKFTPQDEDHIEDKGNVEPLDIIEVSRATSGEVCEIDA
jgi:hypothetical protein